MELIFVHEGLMGWMFLDHLPRQRQQVQYQDPGSGNKAAHQFHKITNHPFDIYIYLGSWVSHKILIVTG